MKFFQTRFSLPPLSRGFHLITEKIAAALPDLKEIDKGLCHLLLLHTSASLTLNENADASVRGDFESHFRHMIPENAPYYRHTYEGADDMPAHLKSSVLGSSLLLPVSKGKFVLGTWQGIYLGEHRNRASGRNLCATIFGA
ncbi:MAG: secondary thiamine-phosphate synthase enzyme YjbQ [Spirochaetia bacterium]|nr:secondary thiamine-phosphate synthase enzyme YjbQ [Spirochaetia bacterium]